MRTLLSLLALLPLTVSAAELTALETRWLTAAMPVLTYARTLALPVDVVVQPQAGPNDVPMAMGYAGTRCKLVLSLRGNPDAEAVFAGVPVAQQDALIEAMAAHELAHCWRHAQGAWHALPAGFVEEGDEQAAEPGVLVAARELRETRREEAYADLVALAWTRARHPADYARVHAWLTGVRAHPPVPRGGHDTRVWVALAADGARLGKGAAPFEEVAAAWREGMLSGE